MTRETAEDIDDAAARWAIRLDAGGLTPEARDEFEAWIGADGRRSGALLRAQAALAYLDRGRVFSADIADTESVDAGPVVSSQPQWGRRRLLATAFGGALAAGLVGTVLVLPRPERATTIVGEVRALPLADGSIATMNTNSRLAASIDDKARVVQLERGEAWFRVAHDKSRPFVVEAGEVRVRAVGTAFSVRRRAGGADVLVTEGTVETWVVGREWAKRRISAGWRGFVSEASPVIEAASAPQEIERNLSWRTGELALDGETLGHAVSELNRYNLRKIVIEDPALAHEQLVGYFRTNEPENFSRAIASMTGAKVVSDGDRIHLVRDPD